MESFFFKNLVVWQKAKDYDTVLPLAEEVGRMLTSMLRKFGCLPEKT